MATSSEVPARVKSLLSSFISNLTSDKDEKEPACVTANIINQNSDSPKETSDIKGTSAARNKKQYYDRVETYSALTWFAKPFDLSPLVCARYGWTNTDTDLLQCVNCHAFLSGQLPTAVDTQGYKESCNKLKKGLTENHEKLCTWSSNPCPESFSRVPYHNRQELISDFKHRVMSLQETISKLPLLTYSSLSDQGLTDIKVQILTEEIQQHIQPCQTDPLQTDVAVFAACGWAYSEGQVDVLQCSYCRRKVGLWNYVYSSGNQRDNPDKTHTADLGDASDDCGDEQPAKKRMKVEKQSFDPVAEHRYWCPWLQPATMPFVSRQSVRASPCSSPTKVPTPNTSPRKSPASSNESPESRSDPGSRSEVMEAPAREPAWLLVMRMLSRSQQHNSEDFCSQMKQNPQVEGLRHLRKVLKDCTSPTTTP